MGAVTRGARYRIAAAAVLVLAALTVPFDPAGAHGDPVLVGAGDIASCGSSGDEATAKLLDNIPGPVFTLGDFFYGKSKCFEKSWGRHRDRIEPALGNHEYHHGRVESWYYPYFTAAAKPGKAYYSYDLGAWHIVVLDSNCQEVGCGKDSSQLRWLRDDLAASSADCTLAYWHHPRFSSDKEYGNNSDVAPFWEALYEHGAEVVLSGHAHVYERFGPQNPHAQADPDFGIRQFTVGTGGASHYGFKGARPNSEVRDNKTYGVLKLTLHESGYHWAFVPQAGKSFTDSGTGSCHGRPT
jgi:calcineurin-like phosphoesterase family protein